MNQRVMPEIGKEESLGEFRAGCECIAALIGRLAPLRQPGRAWVYFDNAEAFVEGIRDWKLGLVF